MTEKSTILRIGGKEVVKYLTSVSVMLWNIDALGDSKTASDTYHLWNRIRPHTVISDTGITHNTPTGPGALFRPLARDDENFVTVGQSELNVAGESSARMAIRKGSCLVRSVEIRNQ